MGAREGWGDQVAGCRLQCGRTCAAISAPRPPRNLSLSLPTWLPPALTLSSAAPTVDPHSSGWCVSSGPPSPPPHCQRQPQACTRWPYVSSTCHGGSGGWGIDHHLHAAAVHIHVPALARRKLPEQQPYSKCFTIGFSLLPRPPKAASASPAALLQPGPGAAGRAAAGWQQPRLPAARHAAAPAAHARLQQRPVGLGSDEGGCVLTAGGLPACPQAPHYPLPGPSCSHLPSASACSTHPPTRRMLVHDGQQTLVPRHRQRHKLVADLHLTAADKREARA